MGKFSFLSTFLTDGAKEAKLAESTAAKRAEREAARKAEQEAAAAAKKAKPPPVPKEPPPPPKPTPPAPAKPGRPPGYCARNPIKCGVGVGAGVGTTIFMGGGGLNDAIDSTEEHIHQAAREAGQKLADAGEAIANSPIAKAVGVGAATLIISMGAIFVVYEGYTLYRRAGS